MDDLLDDYCRHAANHGASLATGDAESSNVSYDRLHETLIELARVRRRNDLFGLYNFPDPHVQCWAAAHTLEVDPARALRKLADVVKLNIPILSRDAELTIEEWKAGNLRFLAQ
ncbi:MAG TPA: DUF2019 domain-containing protein [Pirellulales bacterium]|jgi:hypothetical protein